ncbi:MAG: ABC transporter permease subunit [Candidatus Omnitrophota bacterium]
MFKNKKSWIGIILFGIIIGLILGMVYRPDLKYTGKPVPIVYYFEGSVNTGRTINYALEIGDSFRRKSKELSSISETYNKYSTENFEDILKEKEFQKVQYDKGVIKLNKIELIQLEAEISDLEAIQSYISEYGETGITLKMEEDYETVIQLEKYIFDEMHGYIDKRVDVSDLRTQLENQGKELTALLEAEEADSEQVAALEQDIKSIKAEIVDREIKGTDVKGYKLLIKREEIVDSIISENNIQIDTYASLNDFIFKEARVSRFYIILYMGAGILGLLILIGIQRLIVYKVKTQRFRRVRVWKNNYFERDDSLAFIGITYFILLLFCIATLYPLLNVFSISLRPANNLFSTSFRIIPKDWTFANYKEAFVSNDLLIWIKNSFIVASATSVIGVIFSASAAYAFSRFKFYGRKPGMIVVLITQMFPAPMLLLPTYVILYKMGLKDRLTGLLFPYVATAVPFCIWLLKGYFDTIPRSLEESAYIDGCSLFNTFIKIVLPLAKPALAIAALFSFMAAWSEFIIARIIVSQSDKMTLPVGLVYLQGEFLTKWGVYSAAALITCIPVVLLFIALSRFLVGGLTLGGLKE